MKVDPAGALPLVTQTCAIRYATDGSAENGGMDRGRLLAAMDGELAAALGEHPRYAVKNNSAGVSTGVGAVVMGTNVFWGDAVFGAVTKTGERVERVATVERCSRTRRRGSCEYNDDGSEVRWWELRLRLARRVRAYFAPVNRSTGVATIFDAAQAGGFALDAPPAPWVDLGWVTGFARKSATKVGALRAGAPAMAQTQVRTEVEATLAMEFESWGKLQMAVASGSEQMNLLVTASGAAANGSGECRCCCCAFSGAGFYGYEFGCGGCGGGWVQCGGPGRRRRGLCGAGGVCGQWGERGVRDERGCRGWGFELCAASFVERRARGGNCGGAVGAGSSAACGCAGGGDEGESADRFLRSGGRQVFPGVVGAVRRRWRAGRSGDPLTITTRLQAIAGAAEAASALEGATTGPVVAAGADAAGR